MEVLWKSSNGFWRIWNECFTSTFSGSRSGGGIIPAEKRRYRLCSENDDILLPRLAGIEKGAFVHTCHAGVSELVVPLFEGDRCTEVFLAGVFRRENGESDAAEGDIPVMKEEMLKNLQELLSDLSGILRARNP